jgi:hypothetical protein
MMYHKLIQEMTPEEKKTYFSDVEKWDQESYPRLMAHIEAWTEAEVKEFGTGLFLISAMQQARSFVAKADQFTHDKALSTIKRHLDYARRYDTTPKDVVDPRSGIARKVYTHAAVVPVLQPGEAGAASAASAADGSAVGTQPGSAGAAAVPAALAEGSSQLTNPAARQQEIFEELAKRYGGKRPTHYDEWKHLMSPKLLAMVEELPAYYLELAAAAEMSDKLDDDPRATTTDRAAANQRVVLIDDKIQAVHQAAEKEWITLNTPEAIAASSPAAVPTASAEGSPAASDSAAAPSSGSAADGSAIGTQPGEAAAASEASASGASTATVPAASAEGSQQPIANSQSSTRRTRKKSSK